MSVARSGLYPEQERAVESWREHGIPLDRQTVDYAQKIIEDLIDEQASLWRIIDHLTPKENLSVGLDSSETVRYSVQY